MKSDRVPTHTNGKVTSPGHRLLPEMCRHSQWGIWRDERQEGTGEIARFHYNIKTGTTASATDPCAWATFYEISEAAILADPDREIFGGVFFVLRAEDPFTVVHYANCRDPETGEIDLAAHRMLERFKDSYRELDEPATGIQLVTQNEIRAKGQGQAFGNGDIEVYDRDRFFYHTNEVV